VCCETGARRTLKEGGKRKRTIGQREEENGGCLGLAGTYVLLLGVRIAWGRKYGKKGEE